MDLVLFGRDHLRRWRPSFLVLPAARWKITVLLEPYVPVAFCAAISPYFTLMLSGVIALVEER
jgi:hypothetical protein